MKTKLISLLLILISFIGWSQDALIEGFIQSTENEPIPYANVSVYVDTGNDADGEVTTNGTMSDINGYYTISIAPGVYRLVFQCIGYENKVVLVTVNEQKIEKNVYLKEDVTEIEAVEINTKKRKDPAYEIMKNASKEREKNLASIQGSISDIYIKALLRPMTEEEEKTFVKSMRKEKSDSALAVQEEKREARRDWIKSIFKKNENDSTQVDSLGTDSIVEKNNNQRPKESMMDMAEVIAKRYYRYPNEVKEIRDGYKVTGSYWDMFYLSTAEAEFNFYEKIIEAPSLTDYQVISPLNPIAAIPYKFELIESVVMFGKYVHRIRVTPRRSQTPLFSGEIVIADKTWEICQLDLKLDPYALNIYADFEIHQRFEKTDDGILLLKEQKFTYALNWARQVGITEVNYDNYQINPTFEKKFFNNALLITTVEAIEKDSAYWETIRPKPLTVEEQKLLAYKDSIYEVTHSKAFLDSLDKKNNTYRVEDVFNGYSYYNRKKDEVYYFPSIWDVANPFMALIVGGPRSSLNGGIYKRFKDKRWTNTWAGVDYGYFNKDLNYNAAFSYGYQPKKFARFSGSVGRTLDIISEGNSMSLEAVSPGNIYRRTYIDVSSSREIVNGLYIYGEVGYAENTDVSHFKSPAYLDQIYLNADPNQFDPFTQFDYSVSVWFTPKQKYYMEPYRKVNLGSKWPQFSLTYSQGLAGVFNSEFDYSEITFSFSQDIKLGQFGNSKYRFSTGKYLKYTGGGYINQTTFIAGDKYFFQHPLYGFTLLQTHQYTSDLYAQAHYIHHFNGSILNKIPLLRFLQLKAVVGASGLYVQDSNLQHLEAYVGIEREVKIGGSRLKFGIFPVANIDNDGNPLNTAIRFGINSFSRRNMKWSY